ncbi:hypothetical protein AVEN_198876-1 [Araneus ventricosus]|uniref:Uncharacterized protein n=1 Tax=Araneus ventricosus TaxID=182803 RepID=A0A4Y2SV74_ARAVE|nr:hypothetical protein AVEN_198876-1 [Araneus ventricosus]
MRSRQISKHGFTSLVGTIMVGAGPLPVIVRVSYGKCRVMAGTIFIRPRSTAQNIKVTTDKTKQSTTSRYKHTDKNDREASWETDGSSSATYHRKEKASDCNRYIPPYTSEDRPSEVV